MSVYIELPMFYWMYSRADDEKYQFSIETMGWFVDINLTAEKINKKRYTHFLFYLCAL